MKLVESSLTPVPERKPTPSAGLAGDGGSSSFRDVLAESLPVPKGRLANGQKAPPAPGLKPEPPMLLEDGTLVPLPARKPGLATTMAENPTAARVVLASQQVAGLSGHSFTAILAQATQESGLDAAARNSRSSAAGPFQFLERTWLDLFRRHGAAYGHGELASQIDSRNGIASVKDPAVRKKILDLRHDVDLSAGMAARYLAEGRERLEKRLGRPATETESRIAYVMGVGGATRLIKAAESSPRTAAAELLPSAAKANPTLFYDRASGRELTVAEAVGRLTRRMDSDQREMFAAIAKAAEQPQKLDHGTSSPLNPFQTVALPEDAGGRSAELSQG
ncbi:lytic transglycosylase domain-containing protein [Azospirillum thermophilum]|uniref:Lytic transglycosylase domain-containing protein n=1 Tax=Azospirillum thermophilum TaxID=2202148 RepID=A0A2S2CW64_9PROT|nr:lytic transglycosylase domain-containing protein [Azospirillum thermophilum]AWK88650.1 lytic transglycosylase domain-containing protein [Azospirillum thermophilum]